MGGLDQLLGPLTGGGLWPTTCSRPTRQLPAVLPNRPRPADGPRPPQLAVAVLIVAAVVIAIVASVGSGGLPIR